MPKFPSIPRVSIIVPVGSDVTRFESTLISVLENQPAGCEIIVAHDGSYNDPFELCDEVQFTTAPSKSLVDLVASGTAEARGRFVHVIGEGIQATNGWLDSGLENFEHFDAGCVAPVIRHTSSKNIVAAGWHDTSDRLCNSACQGKASTNTAPKRVGAYLQASFWRRELLRSVTSACQLQDTLAASYTYQHLIRKAGWKCELAKGCQLFCDDASLVSDQPSFARGQQLGAIRSCFENAGSASSAVISNLLRPSNWTETLGQISSSKLVSEFGTQFDIAAVLSCNDSDGKVLSLPSRQSTQPLRRAA